MKIIVAGGTGFLGSRLVNRLLKENHDVIVLTRNPNNASSLIQQGARVVEWDGKTPGEWSGYIDGANAVINLTGESLAAKRWTVKQKKKIISSRVDTAKVIVDAIRRAAQKPSVLVNASAVGYYGDVPDGEVIESSDKGKDFLSDVVDAWERESKTAESLDVRVVLIRTGVVLSPDGGALQKLLTPFKFFIGGPPGSGKQWFPWIHLDDELQIIMYILENKNISGPVNLTAPDYVNMKEFYSALGRALHRPSWAPVPAFILKFALGEMSDLLLTGQKVVPDTLMKNGYRWLHPTLDEALGSLFEK